MKFPQKLCEFLLAWIIFIAHKVIFKTFSVSKRATQRDSVFRFPMQLEIAGGGTAYLIACHGFAQ